MISHPHTDKGVLHADIITSRGAQKNTCRRIVEDLISVLDHGKRRSRGSAGVHGPVIGSVFIHAGLALFVMTPVRLLVHHRHLLQRGILRVILIEFCRPHRVSDKVPDLFFCLRHRSSPLIAFADLLIISVHSAARQPVHSPEAVPAQLFIPAHCNSSVISFPLPGSLSPYSRSSRPSCRDKLPPRKYPA